MNISVLEPIPVNPNIQGFIVLSIFPNSRNKQGRQHMDIYAMYFRGKGVRQNITVGYIRERGSRSALFWCMIILE